MKAKLTPEELEKKIIAGEEVVDNYFDVENAVIGRPRKLRPKKDIIKTNLDLTKELAEELDDMAESLNISRQAVIKMMIRFSLNEHYKSNQIKKQVG